MQGNSSGCDSETISKKEEKVKVKSGWGDGGVETETEGNGVRRWKPRQKG
jgi:hypothetical protein